MVWIGQLLTQRRPQRSGRGLLLWLMALMAAGALALLVFAASLGFFALGLALSARLVFVLILSAALLPWLDRGPR